MTSGLDALVARGALRFCLVERDPLPALAAELGRRIEHACLLSPLNMQRLRRAEARSLDLDQGLRKARVPGSLRTNQRRYGLQVNTRAPGRSRELRE